MSVEVSNELNDSSVVRDFAAEYEKLYSKSTGQSAKIEDLTQEVYSLKSRLVVAERIQADYQLEIDSQQQQLFDEKASNSLTILKLKEEHASRVQDFETKILALENDLSELRQKQVLEKDELVKTRKELKEFQNASPVASLKAELQELMEEYAASRLACEQHQELNQILLNEKNSLIQELSNTREHLEMTEEKLKICKSDIINQSETIEELRESLAVAQNELACLKSGPSDAGGRGNSLFAEVEDKRQDMLKKCSTLSRKYYEMKKDYGAKCSEISRLKMENLQLKRKWQEEAEERDNRDVWLQDNYEIRIKELLKAVNDLKKNEKPVFVNGDFKILTYAEELVEKSRKEMAQLRDEMEQRSSERLNEAKALYMARSEVLTLKTDVMSVNAENIVLRDKLGEANITDIPSPGKTLKRLKKMMVCVDNLKTASTQTDPVEGNNDSLDIIKDVKTDIPLCTTAKPISSLFVSVPKPKRCLEAGMLENHQGNDDHNSIIEDDVLYKNQESSSSSSNFAPLSDELDTEECSSVLKEEQEEPVEFLMPRITMPIDLNNAEIKEQKIQFEGLSESVYNEVKPQEDILTNIDSIQPGIKLEQEDSSDKVYMKEKVEEENTEIRMDQNGDQNTSSVNNVTSLCNNDLIFQEPTVNEMENYLPIPKLTAPRQSILAKVSRPSLVPLNQNINRKVRFADSLSSETNTQECDTGDKQESAKKLVRTRAPKPKLPMRIIVSKETQFQ